MKANAHKISVCVKGNISPEGGSCLYLFNSSLSNWHVSISTSDMLFVIIAFWDVLALKTSLLATAVVHLVANMKLATADEQKMGKLWTRG